MIAAKRIDYRTKG